MLFEACGQELGGLFAVIGSSWVQMPFVSALSQPVYPEVSAM